MDLRIFTEPQQGATYDDLLAVARATEDLGFDGFFRSDHYLHMSGSGTPGPTDAWTTLAGLARDNQPHPARHPGQLGDLPAAAVCREVGRDPSTLVHSAAQVVCVGRDDATVRRRAEAIGREVDELVENGIAGSVEQARDRLGRLAEVGATRVYLQVLDLADLDHLGDVHEALAAAAP